MILQSDFAEFLQEIRPTKAMRDDLKEGHMLLRDRLNGDEELKKCLVSDFLQGSYRRSTAIRPSGEQRSDVDIIVVTRLAEAEFTPAKAMDVFKPFLDKHYKGKWRQQGRSFGIEVYHVEIDLVPTAAPSESQMGLLKSEAVTSDDDLEAARDWKLNEAWMGLGSRERADARESIAKAESQPEWKAEPLRIPDREANRWESTHLNRPGISGGVLV